MKILLSEIRRGRLITLKALEKSSGISKSTIQRIETGDISPTMDKMEKLAKAMGVRITDLFESKYK